MGLCTYALFIVMSLAPRLIWATDSSTALLADTCKAIKFSQANGSTVNKESFFHCHIITKQDSPDQIDDILSMNDQYVGLLCHDHEWDGKRTFEKYKDNVNIFLSKTGQARFMGVHRTAMAAEVKAAYPWLTGDKSFPKMSGQMNFYKLGDPQCGGFKSYKTFSCDNQNYCYGSATGFTEPSPSGESFVVPTTK